MLRTVAVVMLIEAIALFGISCSALPPVEPPYVIFPPYDAAVDREVDHIIPDCRVMCENLAKMGCPDFLNGGRSCGSNCTVFQTIGGLDVRPYCVATASTPDQVRACCPAGTFGCNQVRCQGL